LLYQENIKENLGQNEKVQITLSFRNEASWKHGMIFGNYVIKLKKLK
jgi:hypothetical protein